MQSDDQCPRCLDGRLRRWDELTDEEREIVKRLPTDHTLADRQARHRWCPRCWHETSDSEKTFA